MTETPGTRLDPIERILQRAPEDSETPRTTVFSEDTAPTVGDFDLEARSGLRRVSGLSTELEDVTEVEYRQLRLENVVLIGAYPHGTLAEAEYSLRELALLRSTAGATVLDGLLQQRDKPDVATYVGS